MEFHRQSVLKKLSLFFLAGCLIYLTFLGKVHLFDWDEVNFAECAREMIMLQNYLSVHIDFEPFWEKPPFFFWLQAISMNIFGIGEFASRFPNALLGVLTLPGLYILGSKLKDHQLGLNWAILYACSFLPLLYFKSGIIDPWFNTFIFLSYILMFLFIKSGGIWKLVLSGITLGFAILTKGPAALLILGICAVIISITYRRIPVKISHLLTWICFVVLIPGLWFLTEYLINGPFFIREFIEYQIRLLTTEDAGHGGFPGYHFVVVLLGCFPASVLAFPNIFRRFPKQDIRSWMLILLWVVLILFSLVQSKIIHYSSLSYFPLTFLAADAISNRKFSLGKVQKGFFLVISLFWFLLVAGIPFLVPNLVELIGPDNLSKSAAAVLLLEVQWPKWLSIISLGAIIPVLIYHLNWPIRPKMITSAIVYILFIEGILLFYLPRIESYTQGPAIDFYKEKQDEHCYVENWGFKTYADLFYTKKERSEKLSISLDSAINEGVARPIYIVTKVYRQDKLENTYPNLELLYQKGEFVFYRRMATTDQ